MKPRPNRRRALAIVACALWLFGVEALPGLHLASHDDDHTHARDGSIVHRGEHRHGDVVHSHAATTPEKPARRAPPQLAFDEVPFAHDAAGLAHHAVALHQPAAPVLAPLPVVAPRLPLAAWRGVRAGTVAISRPSARGPPA